jgi:hypothetical protein
MPRVRPVFFGIITTSYGRTTIQVVARTLTTVLVCLYNGFPDEHQGNPPRATIDRYRNLALHRGYQCSALGCFEFREKDRDSGHVRYIIVRYR